MKRIAFILIYITVISGTAHAQEVENLRKNVFKVNLSSLIFRNFSFQYERQIGRKTTVALNGHVMAFGKLPFESFISDKVDVEEIEFSKMKVGSSGIVPEFRFYLGKGALQGFYLGPFVAFKNYRMNVPINYGVTTERIGYFGGRVNTITGGLQLGSHFKLSDWLSLDWWILGPNFGSGSGHLVFLGQLTATEQQSLRDQIENIKEDLSIDIIRSYEVNSTGASIEAKGPVGGVRGFGLNLGIRF